MTSYSLLVFLAVLFYSNDVLAKVAPDYIIPCPGLKSDCLKKTIQESIPLFTKGIPSLGVIQMDPLYQEYVEIKLPGDLRIELFKGNVHGFRKCQIESVSFENDEADLQFRCNMTFKGKYKANGRILIVSLNGDGDAKVKISNAVVNLKIKFHDVPRDGEIFYELKDYEVSYRIEDRVTFSLTNLFQGNPELSNTVLAFLNENWKQLVDEFGKPVFDTIFKLVYGAIESFFKKVPKNELISY